VPDSHITTDTVIIGAGIIGLAVAYYLVKDHGVTDVVIVDPRDPMSLTSAQSGENYRNWWPHPIMAAYTDHSIGLMEEIARASGNRINMTRRGYTLVTRRPSPADLIDELYRGYAELPGQPIRVHDAATSASYQPPLSAQWEQAPRGVDVLTNPALIRATFPSYGTDVATVLHIRRAGSISGQQLGQFMLEAIRQAGGRVVRAEVTAIEGDAPFRLRLDAAAGAMTLHADRLINAAGPFFKDVGAMLGEDLPVTCVYQQKIAFEDREGAIPRQMPFTIDLDRQQIAWTDEERAILAEDPIAARLLEEMPGSIHCRPYGPDDGKWVKLGWAYNERATDPHGTDPLDPQFPDIVLRGASRLNRKLAAYIGRLPRGVQHYGGYYVMTPENWPLIGPMKTRNAFAAGAVSGFGTMAACSTGATCAAFAAGTKPPAYADAHSLARYQDAPLMAELAALASRGVL
jgi:glycine/D-amino acid oxidase-like deaminating enzyme